MKEKIRKEFQLCSEGSCCPTVKYITRDNENLVILEDDCDGRVELKESEWNILKDLIKKEKV